MKIIGARYYRYELPLVMPITIGGIRIDRREGIIVVLSDDAGERGYGEIAPLPGLHVESIKDVLEQPGEVEIPLSGRDMKRVYPSVRCGIEAAMKDLEWRYDDLKEGAKAGAVEICGLIMPGVHDISAEARRLAEEGYRTIKVKVGRGSIAEDVEMINSLRRELGAGVMLRLDANRAWDIDDAIEFSETVGSEGIEYIEEPVGDVNQQERFINESPIPIGLDESITEADCRGVINPGRVGAVILKPAVLGGLSAACQWIEFARTNGIKAVMSCCFQSGLTVRQYLEFAVRMDIANVAAGLDTLKFLKEDILVEPLQIIEGKVNVSEILQSRPILREDLLDEIKF